MPNGGNRAIRPAERTSSPRSELNGDCADRPDSGGRISMSFSPVVMTLDGISHPFLNQSRLSPVAPLWSRRPNASDSGSPGICRDARLCYS